MVRVQSMQVTSGTSYSDHKRMKIDQRCGGRVGFRLVPYAAKFVLKLLKWVQSSTEGLKLNLPTLWGFWSVPNVDERCLYYVLVLRSYHGLDGPRGGGIYRTTMTMTMWMSCVCELWKKHPFVNLSLRVKGPSALIKNLFKRICEVLKPVCLDEFLIALSCVKSF